MASFGREFPIKCLSDVVLRENEWLRDMLCYWHPSGDAIGQSAERTVDYQLRLAIRDGYLNFYRLGQSIAKVSFDHRRRPQAEIHNKFVYDDGTGQDHVKLTSCGFRKHASEPWLPYEGPALLREWIERTYKYGQGEEKPFVDLIVSRNENVIDLEMGLPAYDNVRNAPRMDLVGLEPADDQWRVVFWEVKLVGDGRARCLEGEPRVITDQLKPYIAWLNYQNHCNLVAQAYQSTCHLLVKLHDIARHLRPDIEKLGPGILSVAASDALPLIDCKPRLLIDARPTLDDAKRIRDIKSFMIESSTNIGHLKKLRCAGFHVQMVEGDDQMALDKLPCP
jgi:hypothetical protein